MTYAHVVRRRTREHTHIYRRCKAENYALVAANRKYLGDSLGQSCANLDRSNELVLWTSIVCMKPLRMSDIKLIKSLIRIATDVLNYEID